MNKNYRYTTIFCFSMIIFIIWLKPLISISAQNLSIHIHLRGVYENKISLLGLSTSNTFKSIAEVQGVKNGESTTLQVSKDKLPGEFVLRFDYKEKIESASYPSEKNIIINNQNLELWINPMQCNNTDSTWFQDGEKENSAFAIFSNENYKQKEKIGLLQQFLLNYDDIKSKFYRQGIKEYELHRQAYNQWLDDRIYKEKALFVSSIYRFQYIPYIHWEGTEKERLLNTIRYYFDGIDLMDPLLIKTSVFNKWMDNYVNLYGQISTTVALRDSLFALAGKTAIDKARSGHPLVYGWMVDYFYRGFESNNIPTGIKMLEPFLNDTNCLTSKRMEIKRRLKGIQTLIIGNKTPNIEIKNTTENHFNLYEFNPASSYTLLLFWSADCNHCAETVNILYPWQQQSTIMQKINVVAISLDDTDNEINKWEQKIQELKTWTHIRDKGGVNSKVAMDYFVLATPIMILIDSKTKNIIALPTTIYELIKVINNI